MRVDLTKLPVGPEERKFLDEYVDKQRNRRIVDLGGIDGRLREDYLDTRLPFPDRAVRHFNIEPSDWRGLMDKECWDVANQVSMSYDYDAPVVYIWRAGLAFLHSFCDFDFPTHIHLGISRDENHPTKTARKYLPIDEKKKKELIRAKQIVVADIAVATGGSIVTTIEEIFAAGARPSKIVVAVGISAPEGIWRILEKYPQVEIVTGVIDEGLNEIGYIRPGAGDIGDKFWYELPLSYFDSVRYAFSSFEWEMLACKLAA